MAPKRLRSAAEQQARRPVQSNLIPGLNGIDIDRICAIGKRDRHSQLRTSLTPTKFRKITRNCELLWETKMNRKWPGVVSVVRENRPENPSESPAFAIPS